MLEHRDKEKEEEEVKEMSLKTLQTSAFMQRMGEWRATGGF